MSILVTGGSGFLGSALAIALADRGEQVVTFDITARESAREAMTPVLGDITDQAQITDVLVRHGVTRIVHAASVVGVAAGKAGPAGALRTNLLGGLAVFEAAAEAGGIERIVDLSSEEVYGHFSRDPVPEDVPKEPISLYGITKNAVELLGRSYGSSHGLPYVAARLCWVYGPNFPRNRLPNAWLADIAAGRSSVLEAGAEQTTDFTYIDDAVRGVVTLLDTGHLSERAYNVATGVATSVRSLAEQLHDIRPEWRVELGPGRLQLTPGVEAARKGAMDVSRMRDELGWSASVTLEDGLRRTLESFEGSPI